MRVISKITLIAAIAAAVIASSRHVTADGPSYGTSAIPPVAGLVPGDIVGPAGGVPVIGPTAPPPAINIPDLLATFGIYPPGAAQVDDVAYGASSATPPFYLEFAVGPGAFGPTTGHPAAPPPMLPLIDVREEAGLVGAPPFGDGTPKSDIFTNWPLPFAGPPPCGPIGGNMQLLDGAGTSIPPFGLRYGLNLPEGPVGTPSSAINKYDVRGASFVGVVPPGPGIPTKPVFFTIHAATPWPGGAIPSAFGLMVPGPADVIAFDPAMPGFVDWAPSMTLGLLPGDDIRGLAVSYGGAPLLAGFGAGGPADSIWFSLAPGSPSLSPTSGGTGAAPFPTNCHGPGMATATDIWSVAAPFTLPVPFLEGEMLGLNTVRSGGASDDAITALDFGHCADFAVTGSGHDDPDCDGDLDFANPGVGLPCVEDFAGDANHDGYRDGVQLMPGGPPACIGAFPSSGGLGTGPTAPCAGRLFAANGGSAAQDLAARKARADLNLSGKVDLADLIIMAGKYMQMVTGPYDMRTDLDLNGSGKVDLADLIIAAAFYGQPVPPC